MLGGYPLGFALASLSAAVAVKVALQIARTSSNCYKVLPAGMVWRGRLARSL